MIFQLSCSEGLVEIHVHSDFINLHGKKKGAGTGGTRIPVSATIGASTSAALRISAPKQLLGTLRFRSNILSSGVPEEISNAKLSLLVISASGRSFSEKRRSKGHASAVKVSSLAA